MIRLPNITAGTPQQQILQIQSYLYQLVHDLDYSFSVAEQRVDLVKSEIPKSSGERTPEEVEKSFNEIKALIIKSADIVNAYSEKIIGLIDLSGKYVAQSDFGTYVEDTNYRLDAMDDGITSVASRVSTIDGEIEAVKEEQSELKQTADGIQINVEKIITDGVSKVKTGTGYTFDNNGMRISKSGEEMENRLDNTGMYVTRSGDGILTANNQGVQALNLTARQYLVAGQHARFEDYTEGRTACFWI